MADCDITGELWNNSKYAVVEGGVTQTYGQYGHEITVTYIGPGDRESIWDFLDLVFGKFEYQGDQTTRPCWLPTIMPSPFYIPVENSGDYGRLDAPQCFFADSYQITPFCGDPETESKTFTPELRRNCGDQDYDQLLPASSGAPHITEYADCVNIIVNYRSREAGIFNARAVDDSQRGQPCLCDDTVSIFDDPVIPCSFPGTFVETRTTRDFSVVTGGGGSWTSLCTPAEGLKEDVGIPIHVLTIKHDVVWSNVPNVDELYLEQLSGTVNKLQYLGYPPEAVLFVYKDAIPRTRWDCSITYDVRMQFIVKMANVYGRDDQGNYVPCSYSGQASPDVIPDCVYCGRIGIWNRSWFPEMCHACSVVNPSGDVVPSWPPTCTNFYTCLTHWHKVIATGCNKNVPPVCTINVPTVQPFVTADLTRIFLDSVGCCVRLAGTDPPIDPS